MNAKEIDFIGFGAINVDLVYEISASTAEKLQVRPGKEREGSGIGKLDELLGRLDGEKLIIRSGGGSAANATVAIARMGFQTGYLGKVGSDEEGDFLLSTLSNIDTSKIIRGKGRSGIVLALHTKDQKDRFMAVFPGENDTIEDGDIDSNYANKSKIVHFTSFLGDRSFSSQVNALDKINPNVLVSFDGGEVYARRGMNDLYPFFRRSNVVFPSREEVAVLTGLDYKDGARKILELGPRIVVVTLGENGCYVLTKEEEFQASPVLLEKEKIKDTVGAGDVFAASFLAGLIRGASLRRCAEFGNRMAAKSISGIARGKYPVKDDLKYL